MRSNEILVVAASLLGVALLIVTAVHITGHEARSRVDEIAFAAALLFIGSCIFAHIALIRKSERLDSIANGVFFLGMLVLLVAAVSFWF